VAGAPIARIDSATLQARLAEARADVRLAEAGLAAADAAQQLAAQTEARFRSLRGTGHVSTQSYDEQRLNLAAKQAEKAVAQATLERARASLAAAQIAVNEATIFAPFSGTVQQRYLDEGSQAGAGEPVVRLVEVERTEAHVGIPEHLAADLKDNARYRLLWSDQEIPGTLRAVLPEVDATTRTLTAVFELATSTVPLGAVIELSLRSNVAEPGFWLPLTALTESDRGLWDVFVINEASEIERRLVEIIHVEAREAYVRGTLRPGDRVVKTGVNRLVAGQRVSLPHNG
jgi:RND family efflux transporter MFP subunit